MFDIFNIFFLVAAIVIFVMLRNSLGRRTGHERPPYDPFTRDEQPGDEKVVPLPRPHREIDDEPLGKREPVVDADVERHVPAGSPAAHGLEEIGAADADFDPASFLDGAKVAYEMIVTAYADGDLKTLENLLAKPVLDGFAEAIDGRMARGERVESNFVGINSAEIVDAALRGRIAQVTVKFRSQLVSATRDSDGEVVEGDPNAVRDVTDIWTFERDTGSRDPNWKLAATEAAH